MNTVQHRSLRNAMKRHYTTMAGLLLQRKWFLLLSSFILTTFILLLLQTPRTDFNNKIDAVIAKDYKIPSPLWRELTDDEIERLSKLGRMLFIGEKPKASNNSFKILVWKYGHTIENRHVKHFSNKKYDPFEHCSVKNCEITYEDKDLSEADLVIFHLHRIKGIKDLPKGNRDPKQIWAFLTDESPYHTFLTPKIKLKDFDGVFNWSMTYRMDSDIPVPYGRTVLRHHAKQYFDPPWKHKKRNVLVAILGSNCGSKNKRWEYVKELQKYMKVDVYGGCGTLKCPGHFQEDCPAISDYIFYLAFENSNCDEYITEKLWWNAYAKNSIPVVMGASKKSYKKLLPPNSYIDVDDFARPIDLAEYLLYINKTNQLDSFYEWKHYFEVLNEHGYFQTESFHYCRACEALNYNEKDTKVYANITDFWSVQKNCRPSWDVNMKQ